MNEQRLMARVLHVSNTDISSDNRILKEMQAIATLNGHVVHGIGIANNHGAAGTKVHSAATIEIIDLVAARTRLIPKALRKVLVMLELIARATWRGMKFRPDIVHCHDTMALPVGVIMKVLRGVTVIYDAHELESNKNGSSALESKAILWIERRCWSRIDALISVSPAIVDWYAENLGSKESAVVLNSPIIPNQGAAVQAGSSGRYFRDRFGIPDEARIFIYVGYIGFGRGIEKSVEAFSTPGMTAHLVFLGYGDMSDYVVAKSAEYSNIHMHEAVPHEELVSIVSHADVGLCFIEAVSLSDYYCLPNKLFEYCFSGLRVLASDFPEMKRVIEEYGLGVCAQPEVASMKAAISKLESDEAYAPTKDLYPLSWQAQEAALLSLYSRVAA